jgi:MFS family permease
MSDVKRSIAILLSAAALLLMGNGLLVTLLPLRAGIEGFSTTEIGIMGTAFFAGFALGCLIGPRILIRVGHIRAFAGFAALCAVSILIFDLWSQPWGWMALRGLNGLFFAILFMVIESWLNEQASSEIRGQILSIYIIIANLVTMAGQLMVNLAPAESYVLFTLTAILAALSLVPLSLADTASPKPVETAKLGILSLYRLSPTGFIGCFIIGLVEGAFWSLGPVFAQDRAMSLAEVTFFMAAFVAGGTLSQWPLGRWSDRTDRRIVIAVTAAGTVVTGLLLAFAPLASWGQALAIAMLHGAFMIPLYALCLAHANDHAPRDALVETSSRLLLVYAGGAVLGPVVAGLAMDLADPGHLFTFIAALLGALSLYCVVRMRLRPVVAEEERVEFVPLPRTTQTLYGLEEDTSE